MPEHTPAPTPSRAIYGFVLHLCSNIFFKIYLLWAIIPESWFTAINITYLPQRYWAITIPIFLLTILATFAFVIYPSINLCMTPSISDMRTIKDCNSRIRKWSAENDFNVNNIYYCSCKTQTCYMKEFANENSTIKYSVPIVEDLCIADVSKTLYLKSQKN